jgi:hypothetical protein
VGRDHAREQRDSEAEGLAGAGLRLADEVGSREGQGEGELLDREGGDDAVGGERVDDALVDAELGEGLGFGAGRRLEVGGGLVGLVGGVDGGALGGQGLLRG